MGKFYALRDMNPFGQRSTPPRKVCIGLIIKPAPPPKNCPGGVKPVQVTKKDPTPGCPNYFAGWQCPTPPPKLVPPGGACGGFNWKDNQCPPGYACVDKQGRLASSGTCQAPCPVVSPPACPRPNEIPIQTGTRMIGACRIPVFTCIVPR